jgi:flagellar biosynthesis/type III secretory pathway protein FliH
MEEHMSTEATYIKAAAKIMALVDENPTEVFSLERRQIEEHITRIVEEASDLASDEDDVAYQLGYEEGYYEAKNLVTQDFEQDIRSLEKEIEDLHNELELAKDEAANAFAEGFEAGAQNSDNIEIS